MIYEILFNPVTPYYPSVAVVMGLTLLTLLCSSFTSNCGFMIAIFRSYSEDSVSKCSYPHFSFYGLPTLLQWSLDLGWGDADTLPKAQNPTFTYSLHFSYEAQCEPSLTHCKNKLLCSRM